MRVRELIENSTITEGAGRSAGTPPLISVLLPTFRRGDSGLLANAIDSILQQSLHELELIIIDDASTDSTADVIAAAMRRDARVSVIRHAHNIGLPAISEFEGYRLAQGERIAFAFDDTTFAPDALQQLLDASTEHPDALIVGWVDIHVAASEHYDAHTESLGREEREEHLLSRNVVANSAVLAPRAVLETIGLYDPHVSVARICDYDLWQRARRRAAVHFVDVRVGDEYGPATTDSLGATYPLDQWSADDRMRHDRDALLVPARFDEIDVFETSGFASERSRATVTRLTDDHRATRAWMQKLPAAASNSTSTPTSTSTSTDVVRVIVLAQPIDASTQLVFEGMRDDDRIHVRMIDPAFRSLGELIDADVLICARQLRASARWIDVARAIGIPVYFYLDDNLPLLREHGELDARWDDYRIETLRSSVEALDGVLTSSPVLAASFREQGLHPRVVDLPICAPRDVVRSRPTTSSTEAAIALLIGEHRVEHVRREVMPAVRAVAAQLGHSVRLIVPEPIANVLNDDVASGSAPHDTRVLIEGFATSRDCFAALRAVRSARPSALVVPDSSTINSPFKTLHPLLNAALLATSLVAPAAEPYLALRDEPGVVLVGDGVRSTDEASSIDAWTTALARALPHTDDPEQHSVVRQAVLDERFNPHNAVSALLDAVGELAPRRDHRTRLSALVAWYERELALTRVQIDLQLREPQRVLTPGDAFGAVLLDLHHESRTSRRLHAIRRSPGPLQRFGMLARRGERVELSVPLTTTPYLSYSMLFEHSTYSRLDVHVWASALPGDLIGVEVVHPEHGILLHAVAELPRSDSAQRVSFDARSLVISQPGLYEVRVFARTNQPAHVLEAVHRGRLGLRVPRARLLAEWVAP